MDMNQETILDALNDFERKPTEIPPILNDYLLRIAQNGEILFPWGKLKPLLKRKLEVVCDEFNATNQEDIPCHVPNFDSFHYDTLKKNILEAVDGFTSAPFTIQRLCELVTSPKKHYNRTDKYMRGIEKNVLVVSTVEPRIGAQNDPNANVNPVVNGILGDSPRDDNDCFNNHENNENVSSSNLNTPGNHVLLDNFANVFPTAACIPSPSNICLNREIDPVDSEIDSNFIPTSECVQEPPEVEFAPEVSLEISETNDEVKDEQMDTTNEEQNCTNDDCAVTSADTQEATDAENTVKIDTEEKDPKADEQIDSEVPETILPVDEDVDVSASENIKNEADCSESHVDVQVPEKESLETNECQQDDTVSQSDNTCDTNEISQSDDACEPNEISSNEEDVNDNDNAPEVSQSTTNSDSSGQCMELESSSSEEPPV